MLTKEQNQMLSDIESYNILAKTMLEKQPPDRPDAAIFALKKQNELLSDFMDAEGFNTDDKEGEN